ncbi:metallophosphoesterase family protein [Hirschia litorea]|uniref:Metallophosphoesterase family protein n=1 Tax=Hirschia litorea TaxID=1199156 RepID=A0ABW2IPQ8_9PROT
MFFKTKATSPPPKSAPTFPNNHVGYAIGDIHGCAEALKSLLKKIVIDFNLLENKSKLQPSLIFLGDYIDRGPSSKEVIDILTSKLPREFEPIFLRGNHEEAFLDFIDDISSGKTWFNHGGLDTLASYGLPVPVIGDFSAIDELKYCLRHALPMKHEAFFRSTVTSYEIGDYFFAHAGVNPANPLNQQDDKSLLWIREPFLSSTRDLGACIVHGHTPVDTPDRKFNRINIDTGAYSSGNLTCARFIGTDVHFIQSK